MLVAQVCLFFFNLRGFSKHVRCGLCFIVASWMAANPPQPSLLSIKFIISLWLFWYVLCRTWLACPSCCVHHRFDFLSYIINLSVDDHFSTVRALSLTLLSRSFWLCFCCIFSLKFPARALFLSANFQTTQMLFFFSLWGSILEAFSSWVQNFLAQILSWTSEGSSCSRLTEKKTPAGKDWLIYFYLN